MSSNVGLSTPRGSGTSGYVQRNLSHLKPRDTASPYSRDLQETRHQARKPDEDILEHDRRRAIEVKVFELRTQLEDEELEEDEIEKKVSTLREKLEADRASGSKRSTADARNFKPHQVHELAKAKIEESAKLRRALNISEDYEEGSHWKNQAGKSYAYEDPR